MAAEEHDIGVQVLNGLPSFKAQNALESAMAAEAGVEQRTSFFRGRRSPTSLHIASVDSRPVAAAVVTVGDFEEVPLGLLLRQQGIDVDLEDPLPSPVAELVSLSSDRSAEADSVTEVLYRSFYRHAKAEQVESIVIGMDPWVFDLFTEQYGIPFRALGPIYEALGRELLPAGARLEELEEGVRSNAPGFFEFLREGIPVDPDEITLEPEDAFADPEDVPVAPDGDPVEREDALLGSDDASADPTGGAADAEGDQVDVDADRT